MLFSIGWMKRRYWIPICIILCICFLKTIFENKQDFYFAITPKDIKKLVFVLFVILFWVYMSGIGKYVFQNDDHYARNAFFEMLVEYDWPIINSNVTGNLEGNPSRTSFIYYFGFWIPSAVAGKLFGVQIGYFFQFLWAVLGIFLAYYFICIWQKKIQLWPLLIMIFFSGLDIAGAWFSGQNIFSLGNDTHLEWWAVPYQYSSMTTQLFWVFNQSIPAWLCTIMILLQKNSKNIVFILACTMLTSTFPFVGLIPIVFYICMREYAEMKISTAHSIKIKSFLSNVLSFQNVAGGGIVGIISFLFLKSNIAGGHFMWQSTLGPSFHNHLLKYGFFIILEVGIYILLLYKYNQNNRLYFLCVVILCIIPPFKVGNGGDFCMRASIPALFILMLLVIDTLQRASFLHDKMVFWGLIFTICIGSVTPLHEISRTFSHTVSSVNNGEVPSLESYDYIEILNTEHFSGGIDDSFFFKYIAQ